MDYVVDKWWSMNDKTAGLPHLKVVQRMSEVVISVGAGTSPEPNAMYGLGVETLDAQRVRPQPVISISGLCFVA